MPPRRKSKMAAETAEQQFKYPRISREIMNEVRRQSYEQPSELSKQAETLIPTLPQDLQAALLMDFGEPAAGYKPYERRETNMNLARMIVAFSMQQELDAGQSGDK